MKKYLWLSLGAILAASFFMAAYAQNKAGGSKTSGVASCQLSFNSYALPDESSTGIADTVGGFVGDGTGFNYVDLDKGLRCEMDTSSNNFFLDLNYFRYGGVRRQAWIDLNFPVPPGDPDHPNTGAEPRLGVPLTSDFFFASGDLWSMPIGSTIVTGGQIMVPIGGAYYSLFLGNNGGINRGTGVVATRTSSTTWVLYAAPGSIGNLKKHGRGGTYQEVGFYYFGFTMTIEVI